MITHLADARTRVPLFAARVAPLIDIRAIVDSELLSFPYRGSARWNGLSLSSIGFIAVQRKKRKKKRTLCGLIAEIFSFLRQKM